MYATFGDWIERVRRDLMPAQRATFVQLSGATEATQNPITLSGQLTNVQPGMVMSIDLEIFFVLSIDQNSGVTEVVPGYYNSVPASHQDGVICYMEPRFSNFEISQAINDDLADLSSETNGLYQVGQTDIPYSPVFYGYDLAGVPTDYLKILEVRYKTVTPERRFPLVRQWEELRNQTDSAFPSGNAIVIRQSGAPGLPLHIVYAAPFVPLVNWTDPISLTGLPVTAYDLPPLGAQVQLVVPREVKRNATEAQPDARKATEVPPGAVAASINAVNARRTNRINSEADRLSRMYPTRRKWYL